MDTFFAPTLPHILFYIITILWILEFIIFPSKYDNGDYQEKKSFLYILAGIVTTITLTIILTWFNLFTISNYFMHFIGISFYIVGIGLRYTSSIKLGKYFTRDVQVKEDQELISDGPYKILRHPLYLGLFLLTIAVPLFFQNILMLVFAILVMGVLLNNRMQIEEKNMETVLGNKYILWKNERYRFIPFIY